MEEALSKIRSHVSSNLSHQKMPATLLIALESALKEQKTDATPTAYFAALLTTLDGTIQKKDMSMKDGDVLPAELYLLAFIIPFVSPPVIRSNFNAILFLTAPLFLSLNQHAPALRSQLSLYQAVFKVLDRSQLDAQGIRQCFASILQLCIDPRPKVRKRAAEVVKEVISAPPAPLALHPYSQRVAEWAKSTLAEVNTGPLSKSKTSKTPIPRAETAIHVLALIRPILLHLPPPSLPTLTKSILTLPRLGNVYLSQSSYSVLSDIFLLPIEDETSDVGSQLPEVLGILLSSPPSKSDHNLSLAWVQTLGDVMLAYNAFNATASAEEVGKVWKCVWNFLDSGDATTRKAAATSLDKLAQCFSPDLITYSIQNPDKSSLVSKIVAQTKSALESLAFARAIPELLLVISSLITNLCYRSSKASPTAAESLLLPLIKKIGDLRVQKGFEYKEAADATLASAMHVIGPEVLLKILPLNLEPETRESGQEPRAFLLPLLSQPHPSPLAHFVSYFVPLSEQMFDLLQRAEAEGRHSEAKVWSVLVGQVWSGLVGYCWGTPDLQQALSPAFSQLLSQLLCGQAELRPAILRALKVIVDSNVSLSSGNSEKSSTTIISPEDAAQNVAFIRSQAESWLAVLFNVFGSVERDFRGMVGDVITSWTSIAGEVETNKAYLKVVQLFKTNLEVSQKHTTRQVFGGSPAVNLAATSQDILILLLPHMSANDAQALFEVCLTGEVLSGKDNGVQKRGYKILSKVIETGKFSGDTETVLKTLDQFLDGLTPAAKKDRFCLLSLLMDRLPSTAMHVIPSMIPEAVLGTKEPSEKARSAAFDLIVSMGQKMNKGGIVRRSMVDGMDKDIAIDATASIDEFMTMIAGGLAGASSHMISATITAISRLVFEFKDSLSPSMLNEIFTTLLVFLTSANREIVKSVLGFIKLAIHTLPADLLRSHLKELVPALLNWSHDHKNHFKVKVRHIFERMLRRFSWDEVYTCAGEEEAAKVLVNIKRRKERAKRKKATREDDDDSDDASHNKAAVGDAFEDVLYGSESELGESDEEEMPSNQHSRRKGHDSHAQLRMDDDEPMDLLQGASSKITSAASNRRRKPGQDAAHFKTDADSGKMVIDEEADSDDDAVVKNAASISGSAYKESLTSADGFTRGPNGKVKFNKDTKKRRRENEDVEDVEMADAEANETGKAKRSKKRSEIKLGHEFKAKKAGGDIEKGSIDPYAYVTLSEAGKRGKRGQITIGITGKR